MGWTIWVGCLNGRPRLLRKHKPNEQRAKKPEKQAAHYSGKKKTHTDKNIVLAEKKTKRVSYLSQTDAGTAHDKKIADHESIVYAKDTVLYQDTGFQGYPPKVASAHPPKKAARARADAR